MSGFRIEFFDSETCGRLVLTLAHSLWQFALLVAVLRLADWGLSRRSVSGNSATLERITKARYSLHVVAFLVGLLALPVTYCLVESTSANRAETVQAALQDTDRDNRASVIEKMTDAAAPSLVPILSETTEAPSKSLLPPADSDPQFFDTGLPVFEETVGSQQADLPTTESSPAIDAVSPPTFSIRWTQAAPWVVAVYVSGVVVMLLRFLMGIFGTWRVSRTADRNTSASLLTLLRKQAATWSMSRIPDLAITDRIMVPQIVGLLRPVILLPASAVSGMTSEELELVLVHELAHLRRHDLWVNFLQRVAEVILFFNPALWLLKRRISMLREYCCDDLTCESQGESAEPQLKYAATLLKIAELSQPNRPMQVDPTALAVAGRSCSELKRRIARLFGEPLREPIGISKNGLLAALIVITMIGGPMVWAAQTDDTKGQGRNQASTTEGADVRPIQRNVSPSDDRQFTLKVVGPDGKPVAKANVELRTSPAITKDRIQTGEYVKDGRYGNDVRTNDNGELVFTLPKKLSRFNLSIETSGYGPYWAAWSPTRNTAPIPEAFTAELEDGWIVGGVVVDETGKPVEGAIVNPSVKFKKRPGDRSAMGVGTNIRTDATGQWKFECVPASKPDVHVEISHPKFEPHYKRLAPDLFGLDEGEAPSEKIHLERGLTVSGRVTDESGQPIAGALVRTKFLNDLREATTNENGEYTLFGCDNKMARIVVSAKGKATDLQTVRVEPEMEKVNFSMKPGGHIRIRVIDEDGQPIPTAQIFYQGWRGDHAYWAFDHKDQIADENGIWEWHEAPLDEFTADICRPGGMQLSRQKLIAREQEYVFTPPKALVASGTVVDAKTKKPIPRFRVTPGLRNPDPSIGISWDRRSSFEAQGGRYKVRQTIPAIAHIIRIEANGYEIADSRDIQSNEGNVEINFELEPAEPISATIQSVTGTPAAGARVALGVAGSQIDIKNGDIDAEGTYAKRVDADGKGRFSIPFREVPFHLVITHADGFAHIKSPEKSIGETITLTPWARLEGTYRVGSTPIPGVKLTVSSGNLYSYGDKVPNIFTHQVVTTGEDGRYVFPRLVPGDGRIGKKISFHMDHGAVEATSSVSQSVKLESGKTTLFDVGGSGGNVVGQLVPPPDFDGKVQWYFAQVGVEPDLDPPQRPEAPTEFRDDREARRKWWQKWTQTEEGKTWRANYDEYSRLRRESPRAFATVDRDGSFRIMDLPPRKYQLNVEFSVGRDVKHPNELRGFKFVVPELKDGGQPTVVELGEIQLPKG